MIQKTLDWLDARTSYRSLLAPINRRVLPGGPRWGYVTAACLLWMLVVELVTGFLLMAIYSPSTTSAWASVHYIDQVPGGAFIRGLHYFGGQAMIILFGIHTVRVLLAASFRAPRELVWFTGLIMLPLIVIWAITGNPLSATVKGYAQIEVEGNIIASTPLVGPVIRQILIGGDEVGHVTLTHLYFLHVAFMPLLIGVLLVVHIHQVYRHGLSSGDEPASTGSARPYWPYQSIRNLIAFAVVFGVVATLAWKYGGPLEAPADPEIPHIPRPEWYFLFLFELRAYFVGKWEFIATIVIPAVCLVLLLAMPSIDRVCSRWLSAVVRYVVVITGAGLWTALTLTSALRDHHDDVYQASVQHDAALAQRARALATGRGGVPPEGAISLLRTDPKTQGPILFEQHCASCHPHTDDDGQGIVVENPSAPNLYGFASRKWIAGLLDPERVDSVHYYGYEIDDGEGGKNKSDFFEGEMVSFVKDSLSELDEEGKAELEQLVVALSAEAQLKSQYDADQQTKEDGTIEAGVAAMIDTHACTDCHKFHEEDNEGGAPDLTGYGSRQWLIEFISNPAHERFYGDSNDRMPAFAPHPGKPERNLLSRQTIGLIADWLRGDWYEPEDEPATAEGQSNDSNASGK